MRHYADSEKLLDDWWAGAIDDETVIDNFKLDGTLEGTVEQLTEWLSKSDRGLGAMLMFCDKEPEEFRKRVKPLLAKMQQECAA